MTELDAFAPRTSLRKRLSRGIAANAMGKFYVAVIQLISVPALVTTWGVDDYGVWLMLSTIPTYLALSDFGFSQAATADMTMKIARGEHAAGLRTFQSLWCLVAVVGTALVALTGALLLGATILPQISPWMIAHAPVLFVLTAYAVIAQATRVVLTGFHSSGNYAYGTAAYDALCFAEGLLVIGAAIAGGHHLACALVLLVGRAATGTLLYTALKRRVGWMQLGVRHARSHELKRLLRPALGAMAIPLSVALNVQGMVLVVGAVLSPASVATFAAVRTLTRVAVQAVGVVGRASMPEISAANALEQNVGLKKILRINLAVLAAILLPAALILSLYGPEIVRLWTDGSIVPDRGFVTLMAVGMVAHAVWVFGTQMLLAVNGHVRFAVLAMGISSLSIILAIPATHLFGLIAPAVILIISDLILSVGALFALSTWAKK
ncbi:lipopolysaccharide biosynthesis protein [Pannonibacter sp. P2PFMT1]|uniref:lipopolysaccharide biosynthesis protein n=1 Tax=Pannonibacter sp. P2PFMT1 TaxID=2003582 RepID=UPI0016476440|nr:hypothetical protein [Pannonibacter sp. P2PFMT1]